MGVLGEFRFIDWVTLVGTLLTIAGLIIAIVQLSKTKAAAEAAREAVANTEKDVLGRLWIADIAVLLQYAESAREYIKNDEYTASVIRIRDIKSNLIRINFAEFGDSEIRQKIDRALTDLTRIETDIQSQSSGNMPQTTKVKAYKCLSVVTALLNSSVGQEVYNRRPKD